jgi:hypothetical protein
MSKPLLWGSLIFALTAGDAALAAPDLVGKTFTMTGKFTGNAAAACKVGGSRAVPIRAQRNLSATITFLDGNAFEWSDEGLTIGAFSGVTGHWTQRGNRIDLDFDEDNLSGIKVLSERMGEQNFSLPGGSANFQTTKYDFSARTNAKGSKLIVTESGGFKIKASASAGGGSNSCSYRIKLKRIYKGSDS